MCSSCGRGDSLGICDPDLSRDELWKKRVAHGDERTRLGREETLASRGDELSEDLENTRRRLREWKPRKQPLEIEVRQCRPRYKRLHFSRRNQPIQDVFDIDCH